MNWLRTIPKSTTIAALCVMGLAAADWRLQPDRAPVLVLAMAFMAGAWIFAARASVGPRAPAARRALVGSATMAGAILAAALGMTMVGGADPLRLRALGIVSGAVLVVIANDVPKIVSAPACLGAPAAGRGLQRFTGWAFVLAGLLSALLWAFAPVLLAERLATGVVAVATVLVLARHAVPRRPAANNL